DGASADGASADGASADGASADGASADGASADGASADGASADGASGNGLPEFSVMYPARYPEVIAVGASNAYGKLATFSNSGEEMDIMAPGASILSVDITNGDHYTGLGTTSGTSMSVPYVTAAVAMMLALDPALSADEIKDILTETAHIEDVDSSAGDLNLVAALDEVKYRMEENRFRNNRNRDVEKSYRKKLKERIHSARMASARRPVKN
ncbi:S8 family serine peptidase, partial [Desulfococcus sp.]|uniref:S8 family serine peptidase n=1 Tax=Desulfococcus sp. TaxID=2025834 RepID=UPI0035930805